MTGLASANSGILATNSSGVPSITAASGNWLNTSRTAFSAYASANKTNVTGDGTSYVVLFDTKSFDQATDYTTGTGIFTAPVTGRYQFNWSMYLTGMSVSDTIISCYIQLTSGLVYSLYASPSVVISTGIWIHSGSAFVPLTATDTAKIVVAVSGSTKTVSVVGGALTTGPSYFSGYLVC